MATGQTIHVGHGMQGMTVERGLRMMAGFFVLLSVILGMTVSHNWYWFTLFVGANLFQSAFTNWCPAMWMLKKCGLKGNC
jgi:hypothetical protein